MGRPSDRRRVLWLAKGLGPGGMERLLVHHARLGDRDRFDYMAAFLTERPNSVVPELEELGVTCTRLGRRDGAGLDWVRELKVMVRSLNIDIVHAHSPMPASLGRVALRVERHRPRIVYTEHNSWDCYGRVTRLANMCTYPLDDAKFAVSPAAAASAPSLVARRVEVITHGIDLDEIRRHVTHREEVRYSLGIDRDAVVVVTVANLRQEKGYDVLLQAAQRVLARHPDVVFVSVGQGPLEEELRRQHQGRELGDGFRFLGFRDDVVDLLDASDVFCLASRQEGLPVAFMEAAALGLPPVVTRVGGLPSVVDDGVSGLLAESENSDHLANALGRVISDPALRARLGAGAETASERFDARIAIRRQEAVYDELVS